MFSDDARDELNGFADAGHIGGTAQLWMFPENPRVGTRAQLFWEATHCGAEVRLIGPDDVEEVLAPAGVREILVDRTNMLYTLYAGEQQAFLEVEALVLVPEITRLELPGRVRANEPFEVLVAASNAQRIQVELFSHSAEIVFDAENGRPRRIQAPLPGVVRVRIVIEGADIEFSPLARLEIEREIVVLAAPLRLDALVQPLDLSGLRSDLGLFGG